MNNAPPLVDLEPVTERLKRKGVADAEALEREFRKLALLWEQYPTTPLAPSRRLDSYWHELILDTRRYREFCDALGRVVEHVPNDGPGNMDHEHEVTLALYKTHFGEPDGRVWGDGTPDSMSCRSD
jgi:hypothetical protein